MEVCFLPDDDHTRFVREARPDLEGAGDIVDEQGHVLGHHDAYWRFTVGQRRGLGVATGVPMHVLRVEAHTRRVVVGPEDRLRVQGVRLGGVRWIRPPTASDTALHVRVRHRGPLVPCVLARTEGDTVELALSAPGRAAAPGQSAVIYRDDEVLGGGIVEQCTVAT
jgi:tRNA-specific 2-thiouridylase